MLLALGRMAKLRSVAANVLVAPLGEGSSAVEPGAANVSGADESNGCGVVSNMLPQPPNERA
jgi:hypothetical protein